MKAFFDTNVYINTFFRAQWPREEFEKIFSLYEIYVCPIVKHELLLGTIHKKTRKTLERFFDQCPILTAPTAEMWEEATAIMKKLHWRENRQQNDVLMALTAKSEQATLITFDNHFDHVKKFVKFDFLFLS